MPATRERARLAALTRHRPPSDPAVIDAGRDLAAANLATYIARVVASAPPLTPEQRDRLARLLRPSDSGGRAA